MPEKLLNLIDTSKPVSNICDLYAGTKSVKRFGPGFVPISDCTVQINGTLQCNESTDVSCDHSMDLGVVCCTNEAS